MRGRLDRTGVIVLLAGMLVAAPGASADTVTIEPLKDVTLIETPDGSLANGAGPSLFAGLTSQESGAIRRTLIAFDVAGRVPRGSTITSVTLTLSLERSAGEEMETLNLHRVLAGWGEGTSSASGGQGGPATPWDATWIHRHYPIDAWTSPGGDFDELPAATAVVGKEGFYNWGPTPRMVADVQSWLDDAAGNHGWTLIGNETTPTTVKRFDSRHQGDRARRPTLTVAFAPPAGEKLPSRRR